MKTMPLKARLRSEKGSRACSNLRRKGEMPISLYGRDPKASDQAVQSTPLAVSAYEMMQLLDAHASLLEVDVAGKKHMALVKEVQRDTFGDDVLHVDLEMIDVTKPVHISVSLVLKGDSKGVKSGGRMLADLHEIEIEALPFAIPSQIVVKVDDLDIEQSLHVRDLQMPEGVKCLTQGDLLVVHVARPMTEAESDALNAPSAAAEPEVIGRKKEEEGEGESAQ